MKMFPTKLSEQSSKFLFDNDYLSMTIRLSGQDSQWLQKVQDEMSEKRILVESLIERKLMLKVTNFQINVDTCTYDVIRTVTRANTDTGQNWIIGSCIPVPV